MTLDDIAKEVSERGLPLSHLASVPKPFKPFVDAALEYNHQFEKLVYILKADPADVKALVERSPHSIERLILLASRAVTRVDNDKTTNP